jgi:hypothetical protein
LFAWRDYMPTFTEASLIAAGTGALLWVVLAAEASTRRRTWVGLAGFAALEAATFSRYTNIVVLGCAVIAVLVVWRLRPARLPGSAVAWWLGSVCAFGVGVATFNTLIYGGPLRSGYRPGEITFSLSALGPNLRYMPAHLIQAMPMLVLGLAGLAGRQPLVAITTLAVVAALFGLGSWAFHDMYQHPFGPQIAVVPGASR